MSLRFADKASSTYTYPLLIRQLLNTSLLTAHRQEIVYRDQRRHTYREFRSRLGRLASCLNQLGAGFGTIVGVLDWDSHRYLESYFAIPMIGGVIQTVNVRLSPEQIAYTLRHSHAEILIVHHDFHGMVQSLRDDLPDVRHVIFIEDDTGEQTPADCAGEYEQLLACSDPDFDFVDFDENAIAATFYTTGTTGLPKAVSFTHRQIVLQALALVAGATRSPTEGFCGNDVYMPLTPMFHVLAWSFPYAMTLLGNKQVYPGRYEPQRLIDLKVQEGVTFSHCVPTVLQMLLDSNTSRGADLGGWTMAIGGAAMPRSLARAAMAQGIHAFSGYGASETGTVSFSRSSGKVELSSEERAASLARTGLPALLVDLRIVDEDMRDVAHDGVAQGEIVLRSPWLTAGYGEDPDSTEALWRGGYLHTQDVATIDADGCIEIRDRLKDIIKTGGEWVSSLQLEDIVATSPQVAEVAAIGVPDHQWGERPVIFAVAAPGSDADRTRDSILACLMEAVKAGRISKYALPDHVRIVDHIPKTSVGKADKKVLRSQWALSVE